MTDGRGGFRHLTGSVMGQSIRNWVVDRIIKFGIDAYKYRPGTEEFRPEYLQLMYVLQGHTEASRAAVIAFAQGLHELWHLIPYDKLPFDKYGWLGPLMDFSHEQFKQSCEQLPDSLRVYAADEKIVYPEDFKPMSGEEALKAFGEWLQGNLWSAPGALLKYLSEDLPDWIQKALHLNLNLPHLGGKKESPMQAFAGIQHSDPAKYAELLGALTSLAATDPAIEGMVARIPASAINEGVVDKIIALKNDPGSLKRFIDLLAPDSTLERAGKMVDRAIGPLAEVINASRDARQRLAAARAARRAARQTTPTTSAPMTVQSTRS